MAKLLAPRFRVITYDRRGRGESGDTQPYAVEREIEDIEALIKEAGGHACRGRFLNPERADVALWRDAKGYWRGVLQGFAGATPDELTRITKDWTRLRVPLPMN